MREIFKFHLFFFQLDGPNIEIHTLPIDSNNVSIYLIFFFFQFYAKVSDSDYRAVELSSRWTIDTHPRKRKKSSFLEWSVFNWQWIWIGHIYVHTISKVGTFYITHAISNDLLHCLYDCIKRSQLLKNLMHFNLLIT